MQKIPLHLYIAFNNPNGAISVMKDFGYDIHARNKEGLASTIAQFIHREGEQGLEAIATIHPDRELILSTADAKMGADGFINSDTKSATSNEQRATGNGQQPTNALQNYTPLIVIGGIFTTAFLVLAIVAKK